jgi:hypothetical protein
VFVFTPDGEMFIGLTAHNLVTRLRMGGFMAFATTNQRYMKQVSFATLRRNNTAIRIGDYDDFLLDLDHHGFLRLAVSDS